MNRSLKTVFYWVVIVISAMLLWQIVRSTPSDRNTPEISYSDFMSQVEAGKVADVTIVGAEILGHYRDNEGAFHLTGPTDVRVYAEVLRSKGVEAHFQDRPNQSVALQLLGTWAPLLLLGAMWFFMIRQMQRRNRILTSGTPPGSGSLGPPSAVE